MAERTLHPGDRLSEYVLVERIGGGGFGDVWVARHSEIAGRVVAIKVPSDRAFIRELRAEAFLQSALVHPNIVRTIGLNTHHEPPFFVMDFVEGISLRDLIRRKKRISPAQAARIGVQVLHALEFAHARGVVHRDIKPGNIICGSDGRVRVTDFGLSQVTDVSASTMKHSGGVKGTAPRLVPGTALYMSAEQRRGNAVDGRADVFSLGVVLFEMLTGELPAGCDLPSEVNPRVPPELDAIVKRAMKSDAAQRYPGAAAMRADLEAFLRGEAPAAKPVGGWSSRAQQRWLAASAVATVAIAAVGLLGPIFGKSRSRSPEPYRAAMGPAADIAAKPGEPLAGRVVVKTVPEGADVYVDGKNFGPSPAPIEGLTAGTHVMTFRRTNFAELTVELKVGPGEDLAPTYRLETLIGGLSIRTEPEGALVYVDGKDYGAASPVLDLRNLPAGRHMVRVEMAGFHAYECDIEVAGGRVTERRFDLKPWGFGTLFLSSDPAGARVFVEGKPAGTCDKPVTVERMKEGAYKVAFLLDGYEPHETTLDVTSGDVTPYNAVLTARTSSLDVEAPGGAPVWVDGEPRGSGPVVLNLKAGEHRVRVFDTVKTVRLSPGEKAAADFSLEDLGLVEIPGGEFTLGSDSGFPDARPARAVGLSAFAIDRREVSVRQYRRFLDDIRRTGDHSKCHPEEPRGTDHTPATWGEAGTVTEDWPVLGVDWHDAYAYAAWAGKRLPTEAEWERAARGPRGLTFPWGEEGAYAGEKARANVGGRNGGLEGPAKTGSYPQGASAEGVEDLIGNAWEWCADWYAPDAYAVAAALDPRGPSGGRSRVVRGGSFGAHPYDVRAFDRASGDAVVDAKRTVGFRCAADVK
ncbi:MAG: SUMF1/EgtB/PvdO family nonheme iron enzyme [Planctomycetes bacterium]|nr:SUMF1/EgtB/PvdO family nonheme iron enzyme [Planctomycetota bacterium]